MVEILTDDEILQRLKQYDEKVTKEFFYDTCHMAYCMDDKKYGLRYKTGMDFFSLAHEYFLRLANNDWRQLEKRKPNITLANWMMNGFHYLVRERLRTYSEGLFEESIEERASKGLLLFDAPEDNSQEEVKQMVEEICHAYYGSDRKAQSILRMILIMGMKGKEVASLLGITPAAVSQRYHTMMDEVVRPYFIKYYIPSSIDHTMGISAPEELTLTPRPKREQCYRSDMALEKRQKSLGIPLWREIRDVFSKDSQKSQESTSDRKQSWDGWRHRVTPSSVQTLRENEIFVFGSDLRGVHCGGTAYQALRHFGAKLGQGVGPQGQCYAIPTIVGGLHNIEPYIGVFYRYVTSHPELMFVVTPIGCGIAGHTPNDIAPMFEWAKDVDNVSLPQEFWEVINNNSTLR